MTRQKLLIQAPRTQSPRPVFRERVFNRHPPGSQGFGAAGANPAPNERRAMRNSKWDHAGHSPITRRRRACPGPPFRHAVVHCRARYPRRRPRRGAAHSTTLCTRGTIRGQEARKMVTPRAKSAGGAGATSGNATRHLSLYLRRHFVPQVTRIVAETAPKVVTAGTRSQLLAVIRTGWAGLTWWRADVVAGGGTGQ